MLCLPEQPLPAYHSAAGLSKVDNVDIVTLQMFPAAPWCQMSCGRQTEDCLVGGCSMQSAYP